MNAAASTTAGAAGPRVGRFELRRELGRGAQATVWLAYDERLQREVAVKLMHPEAAADPLNVGHWLNEARNVSRLAHPHIVPVFEADLHLDRPYLVFEYVPGPTLAQHLRAVGSLPPHQAVAMIVDVLDALCTAHDAGVVHRDLKPSNILVDAAGRARVMDFGIAARLQDPGHLDQIVGTPGYMSPEAAKGGLPTAKMDVFSVGLVLIEMLGGERLVADRDPYRAMVRVCEEDLALPAALPASLGDALRAHLRRAIERDPVQRWPDARSFRDALREWLRPAPPVAGESGAAASSSAGTLEFLLRRMRHRADFPALADSVSRIQRLAESENQSIAGLSGEILKDVALTQKLLRLVNTAHYSSAGGNVGTVSRAIALIGFVGVRNLALSLVLLEHMHDKEHAKQLRGDYLRSLMAGMLADELAAGGRGSEEAFIGAMFQNLGRLLCEYYLPEEAGQVRGRIAASPDTAPPSEESAATLVLGIGYQALGIGVARSWGLPEALQACMCKPVGEPPTRPPLDAVERMRWLTFAANQITDAIVQTDPSRVAVKIAEMARHYARSLGLTAASIEASAGAAQDRLTQMAQAMNLQVADGSPAGRLLRSPGRHAEPHTGQAGRTSTADPPEDTVATLRQPHRPEAAANPCEVLAAGIQDITNSMVEEVKLNQILRMVLETMQRALGFRRIVFCLRDPKTDSLTGRFGIGDGADAAAACFKVPLRKSPSPDLFTALCLKGADTLISDTSAGSLAARLPAWYCGPVAASAFLLLPMAIKGAPFALIYADNGSAGAMELAEKELSLLRTLRNQAVMAFRQAG